MFFSPSTAAAKALCLKKDVVFRLLVLMTALLGWMTGTGVATVVALDNLYDTWALHQKSHISIYLPSASDPQEVNRLMDRLKTEGGAREVERLDGPALQELLGAEVGDVTGLPLPVVLDVTVRDGVHDHALLEKVVTQKFPTAEVDDARDMLTSVAKAVRFAQAVGIVLALVLFAVMALLVALTVTAGLRHQRSTLDVLQYIGSTDIFLSRLVVGQVLARSLIGWVIAAVLATFSIVLVSILWPRLTDVMDLSVLLAAAGAPLVLPGVALFAAAAATRLVLKNSTS